MNAAVDRALKRALARSRRNARVLRVAVRIRAGADPAAVELEEERAETLRRARAVMAEPLRGSRVWVEAAILATTQLAVLHARERAIRGLPERPLAAFVAPAGITPGLGGSRLGALIAYRDHHWPPPKQAPPVLVVPDTRLIVPGRPPA